MLETEKQRRWWFATHPEYSSSQTGAKRQAQDEGHRGEDKVSPQEVDEYVDYALQHVDGPLAVFLESIMRNFGTEALAADKPIKNEAPLPRDQERRRLILSGDVPQKKVRIELNPSADASEPLWEIHAMNPVGQNDRHTTNMARKYGLDPDLIRAIMYMETTHGWYEAPKAMVDRNKTILPMNVHTEYWQGLGYSREQLKDPATNIEAGARILKGIISIVERPSVEKVATLYNYLGATKVSRYGARVKAIYLKKPWLEP